MRGTVTAVDNYFTHVRLESGKLNLFNHLAPNAVPMVLRAIGTEVNIEFRQREGALNYCVPATDRPATPVEAKVPVRRRG